MGAPLPVEAFAVALRELHARAGSPTYAELIHQASRQQPAVKMTDSTLSDWFGGVAVPASTATVHFLVEYLEGRARSRDSSRPERPWTWWHERLRQARAARQRGRPGRTSNNDVMSAQDIPPERDRPIAEWTPEALGVHPAIDPPDGADQTMPTYVVRHHDRSLQEVVAAAERGASRLMVLVGGSATGKTRACWQAIRNLPDDWRLWHPYYSSRVLAAAAGRVRPRTVVWLDDLQDYLLTNDAAVDNRTADCLHTMLHDSRRGPILVVGTVWPEFWQVLTTTPTVGDPDPHPAARRLLSGSAIAAPDAFGREDMRALNALADHDPQLRQSAEHANGGRITQYLAGTLELVQRYRNAPPMAAAVIQVAMDARRLGHPPAIPLTFLADATPGYLTDLDWDQADESWLEQALAWTARPCRGTPGPLAPIRPRPGDQPFDQPHYRLADYLDRQGRIERAGLFPPAAFWSATAVTVTDPTLLVQFGQQARRRGRLQRAADLYQQAARYGNGEALRALGELHAQVGDEEQAVAAYREAMAAGIHEALRDLVRKSHRDGDDARADAQAEQAADLGDTAALRLLAVLRVHAQDVNGAERAARRAAAHGDGEAASVIAGLRAHEGDLTAATELHRLAVAAGYHRSLLSLGELMRQAGDRRAAASFLQQAAERDDPEALRSLADLRFDDGDHVGAEALYWRAAEGGDTGAMRKLIHFCEQVDPSGAEIVARRAADRGNTAALRELAELRQAAGDPAGAQTLYQEAGRLGDTDALRHLCWLRERSGDPDGAEIAALEAADLGEPSILSFLFAVRSESPDRETAISMKILGSRYSYSDRACRYRSDISAPQLRTLLAAAERADDGPTDQLPGPGQEATRRALARLVNHARSGHLRALRVLALEYLDADDPTRAEALLTQAAHRGDLDALTDLAWLREATGDAPGAELAAVRAAELGWTAALGDLSRRRRNAGNVSGGLRAARLAAEHGDTYPLRSFARLRELAADTDAAADHYREAIDYGDTIALSGLARTLARAGDDEGAVRVRRFGLTDDGIPANAPNSDSPSTRRGQS